MVCSVSKRGHVVEYSSPKKVVKWWTNDSCLINEHIYIYINRSPGTRPYGSKYFLEGLDASGWNPHVPCLHPHVYIGF